VAGTNLFNGVGANYGATFGDPGLFLRFDVVFDEQWSCRAGSISGRVFSDDNSDGARDESERGISGVTLHLFNAEGDIVKTVYSDAGGEYTFGNVSPGSYGVKVDVPYGYELTVQLEMMSLEFSQAVEDEDVGLSQRKQ
jgi:hypothetical protein